MNQQQVSPKTVAVLVGSLRRGSINRTLAEALGVLAQGRLNFRFIELGDVPMYNEDLWENVPASVTRLKEEVEGADAVLFVTPEYNRSFPAVIKNALDWGTRPYGKNSWAGKPAAIVGASQGAVGTAVGQNALKPVVTVCGMALMGQPEVYLSFKPEQFEGGKVTDEKTKKFLSGFVDAFAAWVEKLAG